MTLRVLYLTGHSAEAQLSAPIIKRLKADPYFEVYVQHLTSKEPLIVGDEKEFDNKIDVVISSCDRVEMLKPTWDWFLKNKIIVRLYAGINTSGGTHDDVTRRMLDAMGHILLCESEECRQNLIRQGEEEWRIPPSVGITHLDDVNPEFAFRNIFRHDYVVVLMNPVTISRRRTADEASFAMHEVERIWAGKPEIEVIILPPNGDQYSDIIEAIYHEFTAYWTVSSGPWKWRWRYEARLRRPEFLGLLRGCSEFISNSSSTVYEAPALGVKNIYNPSWRNAYRTTPPKLEPGGSARIVQTLKSINWNNKEKILRKRFRY